MNTSTQTETPDTAAADPARGIEWAHALRIFTGPTLVRPIAAALRAAGVHVSCEGTEHVYVTCDGSGWDAAAHNVCVALLRAHGTDYGLRPRKV